MKDEIRSIFRDVLLICEEEGLLGGTFFALDGCKLPSNASKEWSGTISDLRRKKERIEKKVKQLVEEQVKLDRREDEDGPERRFSGGVERGRQIERLRKKAERLERWLKDNGPKLGRQGREIKSNVTDNESAIMVTSHGTIQGYNGQALVDSKEQVLILIPIAHASLSRRTSRPEPNRSHLATQPPHIPRRPWQIAQGHVVQQIRLPCRL
jgi:hypothetical protein